MAIRTRRMAIERPEIESLAEPSGRADRRDCEPPLVAGVGVGGSREIRDATGHGDWDTPHEAQASPERPEVGRGDDCSAIKYDAFDDATNFLIDALQRLIAGLLLAATFPGVGAAMTIMALTSPGSALYRQRRVGRDGRMFTIYKIRTMAHDCEGSTGPVWARPGDPRATRFGRFLRRTHLDELPQFWNVLVGDMSLIGPRPERPEIMQEILKEVPSYLFRTTANPGITGLAQVVQGPDEDMETVRRKLDCDRYYILRRGWSLNCRIVLATPFRMIGLPTSVLIPLFGLPSPEDCRRFLEGLEEGEPEPNDHPEGR